MVTLDAALKTRWPQKKISKATIEDATLLGLMPRGEFQGKNMVVAVSYAGQQGRSALFAQALANRSASAQVAFIVTTVSDYAVGGITGEAADTLDEGSESSLLDGMDGQMKTSIDAMKRSLSNGVWGAKDGKIGQCANNPTDAGGPITLVNKGDIVNFEVGMTISASSSLVAGGLRAGTGVVSVVNADAGTVTYTGTITGITTSDYIFATGDIGLKLSGVQDWIPITAPDSTAFFGVDRTPHLTRLSGVRFSDYAGKPILQNLVAGITYCARFGSAPESIFLNPEDFINVQMELWGKSIIERTNSPSSPEVGYDGIVIPGPNRKIKVYQDASAPKGYAYALKLSTWKLRTRGKEAPKFLMKDGLRIRADAASDDYLWRLGYYGNIFCEEPINNAVFTL